MKRLRLVLILMSSVALLFIGPDSSGTIWGTRLYVDRPDYVPGQILVKFKPGLTPASIRAVQERIGAQSLREIRSIRVHKIKLPSGWSVEQGVEFYRRNANVVYAEPNYYRYASSTTPNDTHFSKLWGLNNTGQAVNGTSGTADADINAPEAWDFTTGSDTLVIAVIDSGVDYNHPDLTANIWINPGEIAGNGTDDDGNGYVDDIIGWDFVDNDNDPIDSRGHGTHVAGTIAARGNNGVGITGVCWTAKIMALRILNSYGRGESADLIAAVEYARVNGAKTINTSLGGPNYSQAEYDAIAAQTPRESSL